MHEHEREMGRELRQRQRAVAAGALVRPPKTEIELRMDERANQAEIDHLEERRQGLWRRLSESVWERERADIQHDIEASSKSLEIAFAERRRLRVARELFENPKIRSAA